VPYTKGIVTDAVCAFSGKSVLFRERKDILRRTRANLPKKDTDNENTSHRQQHATIPYREHAGIALTQRSSGGASEIYTCQKPNLRLDR
jgi:hypothetical protein